MNVILIQGLQLDCQIGITQEERDQPQRLLAYLEIEAAESWADLDDDISRTIDYAVVAQSVTTLAAERPRQLIETLAAEIATFLIEQFPIRRVTIEIRKFILPKCDYVAVRTERRSTGN